MNCILSGTFLTNKPIYNLTIETNTSFLMCVLFIFFTAVANYLPNKLLCDDPSSVLIPSTTQYSKLYQVEPSYRYGVGYTK